MFCKYCGKTIPDDSLFCEACGNKVKDSESGNAKNTTQSPPSGSPRRYKASIFLLVGIVVGLSALCGWQYSQNKKGYALLQDQLASLESSYVSTSRKFSQSHEENKSLKKEKSLLEEKLAYSNAKLRFMETAAVVLTPAGNKYHTFDCSHVRRSGVQRASINLRNIAQAGGYSPCLDCRTPDGSPSWEPYNTYEESEAMRALLS